MYDQPRDGMTDAELEAAYFGKHVSPEPNSGCWLWTGFCDKDGYGRLAARGGTVFAHRAMWQFRNGPMPPDLFACHSCDTPCCVNPDHIWPGTQQENVQDCHAKGRARPKARKPRHLHTAHVTVADAERAARDLSVSAAEALKLLRRAYKRRDPAWREAHIAEVMAHRGVGVPRSDPAAAPNTSIT
jgi:hypothetical protein